MKSYFPDNMLAWSFYPEDGDDMESLKQKAKTAGLSVSAYVRRLVEYEDTLISEEELLARCKRAQKNYREGKVYVNRSLTDFMTDQ